jgi:hypothetical protein
MNAGVDVSSPLRGNVNEDAAENETFRAIRRVRQPRDEVPNEHQMLVAARSEARLACEPLTLSDEVLYTNRYRTHAEPSLRGGSKGQTAEVEGYQNG